LSKQLSKIKINFRKFYWFFEKKIIW